MVTSQSEIRVGKSSMSRKNCMRAESGTCNVCFAACSSCMHLNQARMGLKTEELSDESCREATDSQYSINKEDALHLFMGRNFDSLQHTASEATNLLSVNSSHDSFSLNAENKATLRSSDMSDASEGFEMHPNSSSGGGAEGQIFPKSEIGLDHRISSNKYGDTKSAEGHADNISCVSRANGENSDVSDHDKNVDIKNLSLSAVSVGSVGPEGSGKALSTQKLELSEIPSLKKFVASCGSPSLQSPVYNSQSDKCHVEVCSEALAKIYSKPKADTDKDNGGRRDEASTCPFEDKQELKPNQLAELSDVQLLQAASGDETDESDIVEHDVKVCDICGDAGREDLLAICSRCSDGAEHTYCMKEMLQKVPEGDWLCEECKFADETEKQKQGVDLEGKRTNKPSTITQSSSKRLLENLDSAPAAKRQAIETNLGSPKPLSPGKTSALLRDNSFKSMDKGKVRPTSIGNNSSNDVVESARSPSGLLPQTIKGTLLKSNSFSTLNRKAKVKLVDEFVPQRPKGTREQASLDIKERPTRLMSKSMSFKSASSGRSSAGESKLRALSPRPSHVHDLKGLKPVKERNEFERKSLSRLDRHLTASSMETSVSKPKVDQKLTTRGEAVSLSGAGINRESKVVKSDFKGSSLTKSNSNLAPKGLEVSGTPVGAFFTNAMCSSSVEEPSSSSLWTAEKSSSNVNETVQDGLPRSVESTTEGEKSSSCRTRPIPTAGLKGALCQKCKEMGHDVENCPLGGPLVSDFDASAGRISGEDPVKGNKLKAAIEAVIQKLPGTYGRNRINDQLDGLGVPNMDLNCERSSQDQFSISDRMKGAHEVPINKQAPVNHLKPFVAHPTDEVVPLRAKNSISILSSDVKPSMRDWSDRALADTPALSKILAVPEHEHIWQGGFEVHRGGKLADFCCGIQAHLSSCASPKALEMANKFPQKIHLNEVPRVSTWPAMFDESGVKEDNIALYFFAQDYESYERNYKGLVDSLIKNDLALKGDLDSIELLIFPSNQLPENCRRWNMLFFLWGVFRVKKVSCSNSSKYSCSGGLNMVPIHTVITTDNMSLSQNICLPKNADKLSAACDASQNIIPGSYGPDKTRVPMNGNCDNNVSSLQQTSLGLQSNSVPQDGRFDSGFLSRAARTVALLSENASPSLEENLSEGGLGTEVKPSLQAIRASIRSSKGGITYMNAEASLGKDSSLLKNFPVGNEGVHNEGSVEAEKVPDIMKCGKVQINLEENLNKGSNDVQEVPGMVRSGRDHINLERDLNEGNVYADKMSVITKNGRGQINLERDLKEGSIGAEKVLVVTKSTDKINLERDLNKVSIGAEKVPYIVKSGGDQINLERDLNEVCVSVETVPDIMKSDKGQIDLERDLKDDNNTETSLDRNLYIKEANHQQSNHRDSRHLDFIETAAPSFWSTSQKMPWSEAFVDGESTSKKFKMGFAGAYECSSSRDGDSCSDGLSSRRDDLCSSSSNQGRRSEEFPDKKVIPVDVGSSERYFFPVDSHPLEANSIPRKGFSSKYEDRFLERVPNLELALGADTDQQNKGMLPFFVGPVDQNNNQHKPPDEEIDKGAEEDVSASLSLSLSFPPERRHVNTSLFLFGGSLNE